MQAIQQTISQALNGNALREDFLAQAEQDFANRSKGGFWGGMAVASSAGAAVAWFVDKVLLR